MKHKLNKLNKRTAIDTLLNTLFFNVLVMYFLQIVLKLYSYNKIDVYNHIFVLK